MSFKIDFTAFNKTFFPLVEKKIPKSSGKGLANAAGEMLRDADREVPKTPFLKGDLRGSRIIEKPKMTRGKISIQAGFNISYAKKLHEMEKTQADRTNWTLPGSGPKFLQSKMVRNKKKYIEIVALTIEKTKV